MEAGHVVPSPLGRITIAPAVIARIVSRTAAECYGVVGMAGGNRAARLLARGRDTHGVAVGRDGSGVEIELHVVIEHGLKLAEVAATIRSQVAYEVERLTGLPVTSVEVHIEDVKRST